MSLGRREQTILGTDSGMWTGCFHNDPPQLVSGSRRATKRFRHAAALIALMSNLAKKGFFRYATANVKGLLASGLVIDRGHKNDGQIPA